MSGEIRPSNPPRSGTRCSIAAALSSAPSVTLGSSRSSSHCFGEDCHVIANTAWRQRSGENDHLGRFWHIDGGSARPS